MTAFFIPRNGFFLCLQLHGSLFCERTQCGSQKLMASPGFIRPEAAKRTWQTPQFADKSGKHLQKGVGEAELINGSGDYREQGLLPDYQSGPCLLPPRTLGVVDGIGIIGGEY